MHDFRRGNHGGNHASTRIFFFLSKNAIIIIIIIILSAQTSLWILNTVLRKMERQKWNFNFSFAKIKIIFLVFHCNEKSCYLVLPKFALKQSYKIKKQRIVADKMRLHLKKASQAFILGMSVDYDRLSFSKQRENRYLFAKR